MHQTWWCAWNTWRNNIRFLSRTATYTNRKLQILFLYTTGSCIWMFSTSSFAYSANYPVCLLITTRTNQVAGFMVYYNHPMSTLVLRLHRWLMTINPRLPWQYYLLHIHVYVYTVLRIRSNYQDSLYTSQFHNNYCIVMWSLKVTYLLQCFEVLDHSWISQCSSFLIPNSSPLVFVQIKTEGIYVSEKNKTQMHTIVYYYSTPLIENIQHSTTSPTPPSCM